MKKLYFVLVLVLSFSAQPLLAQDYYVLQVKGKITVKKTGKEVAPGDMLDATDELKFETQDATAVIISKTDGRMVLNGKKVEKSEDGEFLALLKNALLPMKQNMKMSTRGANSEEVVNLKDYFGTENFVIIGDELRIKLNEAKYPVSNEKIFVFRYEYNGKPISKIIQFEEKDMIVSKETLFSVNEEPINPEEILQADIWYFNRSTDEKNREVSFKPVFVDETQLAQEVGLLKDFLKQNGTEKKNEIKKEVFSFVNDVYGTVDPVILDSWLKNKKLL